MNIVAQQDEDIVELKTMFRKISHLHLMDYKEIGYVSSEPLGLYTIYEEKSYNANHNFQGLNAKMVKAFSTMMFNRSYHTLIVSKSPIHFA